MFRGIAAADWLGTVFFLEWSMAIIPARVFRGKQPG
jgi:hypothetical protein